MTKLSEFSWERVLSSTKPSAPESLGSESFVPDAFEATEREPSVEEGRVTAPPQSGQHNPKLPYSPRRASDKKRWRWARERVIQALYQQIMNSTPVDVLDAQFMEDVFMLKVDLELFRRIVRGVTENERALDAAFSPLLDRPLDELDPIEQAILRMGAFELIHTLEIPRAVAINEAVEMAKLYGASESHKYINGVLDKLADRVRTAEPRHPA
ncbi:MAG TPA: transcription antitermination factor NusB [Halothiobacillus sp.]|nr:transcription antitermination factor NusB [Halothiobacillus sp.]